MTMAKRDTILEAIGAGGATRESLMEAAEVNSKGLASQFTYLRLMGNCPMTNEDGTLRIGTKEEYEKYKADRAANAVTKTVARTPQKRYEMAEKRVAKSKKTVDTAATRFNSNTNDDLECELQLRSDKADIDLELAEIEFERASKSFDPDSGPFNTDAPPIEAPPVETED